MNTAPERRVVITGMGVVCPLGLTLEDLWAGLVEGRSGVGPLESFPCSGLPLRHAAEARGFTGDIDNFGPLDGERKKGGRILVMGDLNTAHKEIDLARPKENVGTSGFTPIERDELDRWLREGWVDTFRAFDSSPGRYSWWSSRFGVREKNIGWRIDLVLGSAAVMPFVKGAFIQADVQGSDHAPIGVDVDDAVCG